MEAGHSSRIGALDGLRALSFLSVLGCHLTLPGMANGGVGVNVFFVLSGYLITTLLLAERDRNGRIGLGNFYLRRGIRLLPALLALVTFWTAYTLATQPGPTRSLELRAVPYVLLYVGNWRRAFDGQGALYWFGHTWSLSIEEQFYLIWPILLVIAARWGGRRAVLVTAVAGSVASGALRLALWHGTGSVGRIYNSTDTVADQLLIGCALAVLLSMNRERMRRVCRIGALPGALVLVALVPIAQWQYFRFTVGYTVVAVAAALVVGYLVLEPRSVAARALASRPLAFVGVISYGLYLWHFPIILAAEGHLHNRLALAICATAATFVAAYASWVLVERPLLRRGRRGSRTPVPPTTSGRDRLLRPATVLEGVAPERGR
jgi:peptidoglycan/LPS O-acetylase OafA/YrhL